MLWITTVHRTASFNILNDPSCHAMASSDMIYYFTAHYYAYIKKPNL